MRNSVIRKINILKKLTEFGIGSVESFFPKNYSYSKWSREVFGMDSNEEKEIYLVKKELSNILSQLKKDGLVRGVGPKKKYCWLITQQGKEFIQKTKEEFIYEDNIQRLVIFDIPERDKKKRNWLRNKLILLKYKMLQKSVWLGNVPLPEKFILDINLMKLQPHIHIFSVQKSGTIDTKSSSLM